MKKAILGLALTGLLLVSGPVFADLCTIDDVPAATLLLPYFEVDLDNADGVTTLFSVNNASAAPILAHVTLWTDWSVATIDFDVFLTGYDVQTFNVRDIFEGNLPQTSPIISNQGAFSDTNAAPANCAVPGDLPIGTLGADLENLLAQAHTGNSVDFFAGACAGSPKLDGIARGYITVDEVDACSIQFPNSPGYFDTIAGFDDVLWGDYFYVDPANNFAQGETLVHIEAYDINDDSDADELAFAPGDYTFYGRYVGFDASDQREPLPSTFAARYLNGGIFTGGTDFLCWRDAKQDISPVACGTTPAPMPLGQSQVVIFDEEENPALLEDRNVSPAPPNVQNLLCPIEAQRTEIGGSAFPVDPDFGWIYANLNTSTGAAVDPYAQAWITPVMDADERFSVGFDAIQLNSLCEPTDVLLGQ